MGKYQKPEFYITEFNADGADKTQGYKQIGAIIRSMIDGTVLVPTEKRTERKYCLVTFSETGEFLWKKLSKKHTEEDLVHLLAEAYGKREQDIRKDVDEFITKAIEKALIVYDEGS
nr:PqqD family protein [uncultured Anaerostipes sp.]